MIVRVRYSARAVLGVLAFLLVGPVTASAQAGPGQGGQGQSTMAQPAPRPSNHGVTVLKGTPLSRTAPAEAQAPAADQPAVGSDDVTMESGGRHMWMVDRANGQVTDCQTLHTSTPGRGNIDCTTQQLPVPTQ